jgi:hypothetical protein
MIVLSACGAGYIRNTKVKDNPKNREVIEVVERYRRAVQSQDRKAFASLISRAYYENSSTIETSEDDYGYEELANKILPVLSDNVDKVFYSVKVMSVTHSKGRCFVDFEYTLKFRVKDVETSRWALKNDVNRLELVREDDVWRIRSGM